MLNLTLLSASNPPTEISPELREASPWLNDVVTASNGMMNSGIDPGLALATIAAVPVILKVLNMINQFTVAAIEDWKEANSIRRERERLALEVEAERTRRTLASPQPLPAPAVTSQAPARPTHPTGRRVI
jgi:hypothetical protein